MTTFEQPELVMQHKTHEIFSMLTYKEVTFKLLTQDRIKLLRLQVKCQREMSSFRQYLPRTTKKLIDIEQCRDLHLTRHHPIHAQQITIESHSTAQVPCSCLGSTCGVVSNRPLFFSSWKVAFPQFPNLNRSFCARSIIGP